jgi:hypothetical protein
MAKEGDLKSVLVDSEEFIKDAAKLVDDVRAWLDKN